MRFNVESDSVADLVLGFFLGAFVSGMAVAGLVSNSWMRSIEEFKKEAIHAGVGEYRCDTSGVSEFRFITKEEKK